MKPSIILVCVLALIGPIFLFTTFGKSGGLQFHSKICVSSEESLTRSGDVIESLLKFGVTSNMHTRNISEIAGKVKNNEELMLIEFWSQKYFPVFRLQVKMNPKHGGSHVALFGRQEMSEKGEKEFAKLVSMLKAEHEFSLSEPGDINECS